MKLFRKIATVLFVLCLSLGIWAIAACTDKGETDGDGKVTYKITVTCEEPLYLFGISVEMKDSDGATVDTKGLTNGVASFKLDKGNYTAYIIEDEGFEGMLADNNYVYGIGTVTADKHTATINIVTDDSGESTTKISYKVTVAMPDGTPVPDVSVQLCGGPNGLCNTKMTNAQGVAEFELAAGDYEVHIMANYHPAGHTFDNTEYTMDENGGEITVKFKEV